MKNKKCKTIDEHIQIAKYDIIVYSIILTILFFGLLYICYKIDFYGYMFLSFFCLFLIVGRIQNYIKIKKLKNYLVNINIINDMGNIYFWNEENYMLTDEYMIIFNYKNIEHFKYKEIEEIHSERKIEGGGRNKSINEYLNIKLLDERIYKVLTSSTNLVNIINKDISEFLIEKNKDIKIIK